MSVINLCVRVVFSAAVVGIAGCTTLGPDFKVPQTDLAATWDTQSQAVEQGQLAGDWWSTFNDPVLDQLVKTAYRQNLPLQAAGLRIVEARAQLGIAVGRQYPQSQQLNGALTKVGTSKNSPNFLPEFIDDRYKQANVGLNAAWEADFWGRFRRGVESAEAGLGATIADYDNALVSLTAEVARTYVVLRTLEARRRIAADNSLTQERSYKLAEVRFRNGAVSELDPAQALSLLKSTQSSVPQFDNRIRQTRHALGILLGMPPGKLRDILHQPGAIPQTPVQLNVGVPADLLRRRPDIRRAELRAAAQSALIGVAKSDLYPRFSLTGSIGFVTANTNRSELGDLLRKDSLAFSYGPSASWNILNYGRLKNQVRVQDARLEQSIVDYQNTVLEAAREVEDGISAYVGGLAQRQALADSVTAASRAVDLALLQYREGAVDYQRVLDTQQTLLRVQDAYTSVRGQVLEALIAVYKALGGGWEMRAGQVFVPEQRQRKMRERTDWGHLLDKTAPEQLPAPAPGGSAQSATHVPDR